jgi:hypothetical protein
VRFIADQETEVYIAARSKYFYGLEHFKKTNETLRKERERKSRSKMGKRSGFMNGNHGTHE